jgi:hypothetical protein
MAAPLRKRLLTNSTAISVSATVGNGASSSPTFYGAKMKTYESNLDALIEEGVCTVCASPRCPGVCRACGWHGEHAPDCRFYHLDIDAMLNDERVYHEALEQYPDWRCTLAQYLRGLGYAQHVIDEWLSLYYDDDDGAGYEPMQFGAELAQAPV